jgi:hypothetical protein
LIFFYKNQKIVAKCKTIIYEKIHGWAGLPTCRPGKLLNGKRRPFLNGNQGEEP